MKSKLMTKLALAAAIVCAAVGGAEARVDFFWKMGGVSSDSDACSTYFFATTDDPSGWYKQKDYLTTLSDVIAQVNKGEEGNINDYYYNADGSWGKCVYSSPSAYCANTESWYEQDGTPPSAAKFIALILDSRDLSTANNYMIAKTSDGVMELSATKSEATTIPLMVCILYQTRRRRVKRTRAIFRLGRASCPLQSPRRSPLLPDLRGQARLRSGAVPPNAPTPRAGALSALGILDADRSASPARPS